MKIIVSNRAFLSEIPAHFERIIKERLSFPNPKWIENERRGFWNGDTEKDIHGYEKTDGGLLVPRGFCRQMILLCKKHHIEYRVDDQRRILPEVNFQFHGELKNFQRRAVGDISKRDFRTLYAATGCGKTVMALHDIAGKEQSALVICHTKELLYQWRDRAVQFLGMDEKEIGLLGAGKKTVGDRLTIGIVNTVVKMAHEIRERFGNLVIDECHRVPTKTFTDAVSAFDTKYMLGLSATPFRRDGLTRLIYWYIGDVAHQVPKDELIQNGDILDAKIIIRETDFQTSFDPSEEYQKTLTELTENAERNHLICSDVAQELKNGGGTCLVLSDRKAHCATLQEILKNFGIDAELLTGDLTTKRRKEIVDRIQKGEVKAICATGALIGEGFDCRNLENLFISTPVKFSGRVIQYVGRILRPEIGKQPKVFDYVDKRIGVLAAAAKSRMRVFRKQQWQ